MSITRLGINPEWLRAWNRQSRFLEKSIEESDMSNRSGLEYYANHGVGNQILAYEIQPVSPPYRSWEMFLPDELRMFGQFREFEFERANVTFDHYDRDLATKAFDGIFTSEAIAIWTHKMFPLRFEGRTLRMMDLKMVPYAALGLIIGEEKRAIELASAQVAAYDDDQYFASEYYPIFIFMLRIWADFLSKKPITLAGDALVEPTFNALFEVWRDEDPGNISDICLAACDFHTHRCTSTRNNPFVEFDNGHWMRIPIELLLLFKLRRLMGLRNPDIDHPLMKTMLPMADDVTVSSSSELIGSVRSRMIRDGYNESEIFGNPGYIALN